MMFLACLEIFIQFKYKNILISVTILYINGDKRSLKYFVSFKSLKKVAQYWPTTFFF